MDTDQGGPAKRRHLGRSQRAGLLSSNTPCASSSDQGPSAPRFDSELGVMLLKRWAWGLPAAQVQQLAMAAHADELRLLDRIGVNHGYASNTLRHLANLGGAGKFEGNIKRDLLAYLGDPQAPAPTW
eukprot:11071068-Lingulodinium_polyedra.AAC.1